jgi:hypothetical protein
VLAGVHDGGAGAEGAVLAGDLQLRADPVRRRQLEPDRVLGRLMRDVAQLGSHRRLDQPAVRERMAPARDQDLHQRQPGRRRGRAGAGLEAQQVQRGVRRVPEAHTQTRHRPVDALHASSRRLGGRRRPGIDDSAFKQDRSPSRARADPTGGLGFNVWHVTSTTPETAIILSRRPPAWQAPVSPHRRHPRARQAVTAARVVPPGELGASIGDQGLPASARAGQWTNWRSPRLVADAI